MGDIKLYVTDLGGDDEPIVSMYRQVRCMECAHVRKNPLVGCGYICECFDSPLPDQDGFCAWGETEEDYADE